MLLIFELTFKKVDLLTRHLDDKTKEKYVRKLTYKFTLKMNSSADKFIIYIKYKKYFNHIKYLHFMFKNCLEFYPHVCCRRNLTVLNIIFER